MKKIICSNLKKELSKLINKQGVFIVSYFKKELGSSKFNITYTEFLEILKEEKSFFFSKENNHDLIKIKDEFFKSKDYILFEEELYNWNYVKTLFREDLNFNILLVYKLIKDLGEINYAEIGNYLKKLMNVKLDIKQISHYCKEIKIMGLIMSEANANISNEKIVKLKKIEYKNLSKKMMFEDVHNKGDENNKFKLNKNEKSIDLSFYVQMDIDKDLNKFEYSGENLKDNYENLTNCLDKEFIELDMFNKSFINHPNRMLNLDLQENQAFLNLENQHNIDKSYLENRFSYIVDDNNFMNNVLFHLELASDNSGSGGLTQNQLNLVTGFMGREKSIGRILLNMKKAELIKSFLMSVGRKHEFMYFIKDRSALPKYLFNIAKYFKNKRNKDDETNFNLNGNDDLKTKILDNSKNCKNVRANDDEFDNYEENSMELSFEDNEIDKKSNKKSSIISEKRTGNKSICNYISTKHKLNRRDKNESDPDINNKLDEEKEINLIDDKKNKISQSLSGKKIQLKNFTISSNTYKTNFKFSASTPIIDIHSNENVAFVELNHEDFYFILNKIKNENKYKDLFLKYKNEFNSFSNEKLEEEKILKKNILLDYFYSNSDIINLKTLSFISFNRYLFCLNKINEYCLILAINIKHLIVKELEYKTGFSIDRKTLQKILGNLHKLGLIKMMEYELIMKNKIYHYSNNRSEIKQNKIIAMKRDLEDNQELQNIIEYLIKPKCQSKNEATQNSNNIPIFSYLNSNLLPQNIISSSKKEEIIINPKNTEMNDFENNKGMKEFDSSLESDVFNGFNSLSNSKIHKNLKKPLIQETLKEEKLNEKNCNFSFGNIANNILKDNNEYSIKHFENKNKDKYFLDFDLKGLKIKEKQNYLIKLISILEKKFKKTRDFDLKKKFFHQLKKFYFSRKNLNFIFNQYSDDCLSGTGNEKKELLNPPISSLNSNKNHMFTHFKKTADIKNSEINEIKNESVNKDYFMNLFLSQSKVSIEVAAKDSYLFEDVHFKNKENIQKIFSDEKEIPIFKYIEDFKLNNVILPSYIKKKILNSDNEEKMKKIDSIKNENNSIYQENFEETKKDDLINSYKNIGCNKKNSRFLMYSSCLLSEKEIQEEKNSSFRFYLDDFIKENFKNKDLELNEFDKKLAFDLFSTKNKKIFSDKLKNNIDDKYPFDKFNTKFAEKENLIIEFLKVKKKRDNSDSKKYLKLIDFYSVIFFIYFNPRTTLNKIKKIFKYNEYYSDVIAYLVKLELIDLKLKNDYKSKLLSVKDIEIELKLDENINSFIKIN